MPARKQRTFEQIQKPIRSRGCPRCGNGEANTAQISVIATKLGVQGTRQGAKNVASRSVSCCESCCVELYEALRPQLPGR